MHPSGYGRGGGAVDRERAKQGKPPKGPATIARAEALSALFAGLGLALADTEDEAPEPGQRLLPPIRTTVGQPRRTCSRSAADKFVGRFRVLTVINCVGRTKRSPVRDHQAVEWSPAARAAAKDAVLRIMRRRYPGRRIAAHWNERDAAGEIPSPRLNVDRGKDAA